MITQKLIHHEITFESLHDGDLTMIGLQPKMDCSGIWTEGYGKAMVYEGDFLKGIENKEKAYQLATIHTEAEAIANLTGRLTLNNLNVLKWLKIALNQDQLDALNSHFDNCGYSQTLYKLINSGKLESNELKDFWTCHYITSMGVRLPGLIKRRCTEYHWFLTGIWNYEAWKCYYKSLY
jgi:lysozyme